MKSIWTFKFAGVFLVAIIGLYFNAAASAERTYRNIYNEPDKIVLDDGIAKMQNYFGAGIVQTFATFKQKHFFDGMHGDSENYLTAVPGFELFLGTSLGKDWRGEIVAGFISAYSKTDDDVKFSIQTYYALAGMTWDFHKGLHLDGGFGLAASEIGIKSYLLFTPGSVSNTNLSPMFSLGFGYRMPIIGNKYAVDFSYRFMGFWGDEQTTSIKSTGSDYTSDIGFIANHQIRASAAYNF